MLSEPAASRWRRSQTPWKRGPLTLPLPPPGACPLTLTLVVNTQPDKIRCLTAALTFLSAAGVFHILIIRKKLNWLMEAGKFGKIRPANKWMQN